MWRRISPVGGRFLPCGPTVHHLQAMYRIHSPTRNRQHLESESPSVHEPSQRLLGEESQAHGLQDTLTHSL